MIFDHVNLKIKEQQFVRITGPSGSGKSTFMRLMCALMNPTNGRILYQGQPVLEQNILDYRRQVSYFFQNPLLFGETVRDNLAFPANIRKEPFDEEKAINWLEELNLTASDLDESIHDLSGGERQRVAFIRNLLNDPQVLLLDEVTSSLDAENRDLIISVVKKLNQKGKTILWVTHFEQEITGAESVLEIADGQVHFLNE